MEIKKCISHVKDGTLKSSTLLVALSARSSVTLRLRSAVSTDLSHNIQHIATNAGEIK